MLTDDRLTNTMRITVTGASGFLGRAVMDAARRRAIGVRAIGRRDATDPAFVRVSDYGRTPAARSDEEFLVHLAQSNRIDQPADRTEAVSLIKDFNELGYRRLCYVSSAIVYGDREDRPHRADEAISNETIYAALKLECEEHALARGGIIVRPTNLYGPGQSAASVLSRILSQIPGRQPLRVRSASPIRDFCHIDDAAEAILDLCNADTAGIFNVGSGKSVSIGVLARMALEVAGESRRVVLSEEPEGERSVVAVDISETTKVCGWRPRTELAAGIEKIMMGDK